MSNVGRTIYRFLVILFALGVVLQFFLAGVGAFRVQHNTDHGTLGDKGFGDAFAPHSAVGFALLIVGLLAAPAGAASRLTTRPLRALGLSAGIAVASMWLGLTASYLVPKLPPSFAILAVATLTYLATAVPRLRPRVA